MYALAHTLNDPRGAPRGLAGARPGPIQDLPGPLPGLSRGTPTPTRFHPHYLVPKLLFGNLPPRNSVSPATWQSEHETEFRESACPNGVWARGESTVFAPIRPFVTITVKERHSAPSSVDQCRSVPLIHRYQRAQPVGTYLRVALNSTRLCASCTGCRTRGFGLLKRRQLEARAQPTYNSASKGGSR
jgi:hypothetical protein